MKAYMGYMSDEPNEGACLIFAHNAREALKLARPIVIDWFMCDFIEVRVSWIRQAENLFKREANKVKLERDEAHVIDSPTVCPSCELWTDSIDDTGYCEGCREEMEDVNVVNASPASV